MSRYDSQYPHQSPPQRSYPPQFGQGGHPNPNMRRPPGSGNKKIWLWIAGGFALMTLCCCGGGLGLSLYGLNLIASEIEEQLKNHPDVVESFGEFKSFKINFTASNAIEDPDTFAYDIEGTKRSGTIIVTSVQDPETIEEIVISARFVDDEGVQHEIDMADH